MNKNLDSQVLEKIELGSIDLFRDVKSQIKKIDLHKYNTKLQIYHTTRPNKLSKYLIFIFLRFGGNLLNFLIETFWWKMFGENLLVNNIW